MDDDFVRRTLNHMTLGNRSLPFSLSPKPFMVVSSEASVVEVVDVDAVVVVVVASQSAPNGCSSLNPLRVHVHVPKV